MCYSVTWVVVIRGVCMFMCVVIKLYLYNLYTLLYIDYVSVF